MPSAEPQEPTAANIYYIPIKRPLGWQVIFNSFLARWPSLWAPPVTAPIPLPSTLPLLGWSRSASSESESELLCNWRSVSQYVLVSSPIWDFWPEIYIYIFFFFPSRLGRSRNAAPPLPCPVDDGKERELLGASRQKRRQGQVGSSCAIFSSLLRPYSPGVGSAGEAYASFTKPHRNCNETVGFEVFMAVSVKTAFFIANDSSPVTLFTKK
jgi:hypothetical protein